MRRRTILTAALLLTPALALAAGSPRDFVAQVYRGAGGNASWDTLFARAMGRKRPFSKKFDAVLKAADANSAKTNEPWLDFDPVSNSQDPSIHGLSVNIVADTSDSATLSAEFRYGPEPKSPAAQVIYDFVREGGAWALDDIRGARQDGQDPGWSLRKLAFQARVPRR